MTIASVLTKFKGSSDGHSATTTAGNNTGATFGVAVVSTYADGDLRVTDNVGNDWKLIGHFVNDFMCLSIYRCDLPITSATYQLTAYNVSKSPAVFVRFWSGLHLPTVVHRVAALTTGTSASPAPGSVTPADNDCLCVTAFSNTVGTTLTCAPVTSYDSLVVNAQGNHLGGGLGETIQTTAAAFNPTWTSNGAAFQRVGVNLVFLPSVATETCTFTNRPQGQVVQRAAGTETKSLACSGKYVTAGTVADVQGRLVQVQPATGIVVEAMTWTTLTGATIAGGNWSGTLPLAPQGGPYAIQFRTRNAGTTVLATSPLSEQIFFIGACGVVIGQSNGERHFTPYDPPPTHPSTRMYDSDGWRPVEGDGAITTANQLFLQSGVPIGLLNYAVPGSGLHYDAGSGEWQSLTAGQPWPLASAGITASGGDIEFVIARNGEADAYGGVSAAQFKTSSETLYGRIRTLVGRTTDTLPYYQAIMGPLTEGSGATNASITTLRTGQYNVATQTTGAACAGSAMDGELVDDFHFGGPHYIHMGHRYAQAVLYGWGLVTSGALGARVTAARRIGSSSTIVGSVDHEGGTALLEADLGTSGAGLTGFEFTDDDWATTIDIASTAFNDGELVWVLEDNPATSADLKMRYQHGLEPDTSNAVYDNTLPTEDTIGLPLLPTTNDILVSTVATAASGSERMVLSTSGRLPTTDADEVEYKVLSESNVELVARTNEGVFQDGAGDDFGFYHAWIAVEADDDDDLIVMWYAGDEIRQDRISASGGGATIPVNQVRVPPARTWKLKQSGDGLVGESPIGCKVGNDKLYAVDFSADLATNGQLTGIESIEIIEGDETGLTFDNDGDDQGVDRSTAKLRIEATAADTYFIEISVSYDNNDGGGTSTGVIELRVSE